MRVLEVRGNLAMTCQCLRKSMFKLWSIESQYTVYLGLQDKTSIEVSETYSQPTIKMAVSTVYRVSLRCFFNYQEVNQKHVFGIKYLYD